MRLRHKSFFCSRNNDIKLSFVAMCGRLECLSSAENYFCYFNVNSKLRLRCKSFFQSGNNDIELLFLEVCGKLEHLSLAEN